MKKRIPILALITVLSLFLFACHSESGTDVLTESGLNPADWTQNGTKPADTESELPATEQTAEATEPSSSEEATEQQSEEGAEQQSADVSEQATEEPSSKEDETEPSTEKPAEEPTNPAPADPSDKGAAIAATANGLIGKTYEFGAVGPETFDNSGLVYYCCKQNGVTIPRKTSEFITVGTEVGPDKLQPGDIVLFALEEGSKTPDFAGIYIGSGSFISCNNETVPTGTHSLSGFWGDHFLTGRRVG